MNSCMGATISLLVTFVTVAYAWTRFSVLLEFGDTNFQEREDYRGSAVETEVFSQSDTNFNIAFGLQSLQNIPFIDSTDYLDFTVWLSKDERSGGSKELGFHRCN